MTTTAKYHTTSKGLRWRLGPTPRRFDEIAGENNPFKKAPRGKFEVMQEQLDLPYHVYVLVRARRVLAGDTSPRDEWIEFEHTLELPMRVTTPDGTGQLDYAIDGQVGVILDHLPNVCSSYPSHLVDPLPERIDTLPCFEEWIERQVRGYGVI